MTSDKCEHGVQTFWCPKCNHPASLPLSDNKPREWWIQNEYGSNRALLFYSWEINKPPHATHVIEHSAYLEAVAQAEKWRDEYENLCKFATDYEERAERAEEKLKAMTAKYEELLSYMPKVPTQPHEKGLAQELTACQEERDSYVTEAEFTISKLTKERDLECSKRNEAVKMASRMEAERDDFIAKYKNIELANAEMTRNDHVEFGFLIGERLALKAKLEVCVSGLEAIEAMGCTHCAENATSALAQLEEMK